MNRRTLNRAGVVTAVGMILLGLLVSTKVNPLHALNLMPDPQTPEEAYSTVQQPDTVVESQLVEANTKFGFNLFSEVLKEDAGKNVFISPTSVAIALAMTYNGAAGETQQAMAEALEMQGMSVESLNQANQVLKASLQNADPDVQLAIANSLWANQGVSFKPEFIRRNQQFYQAKLTELDFGMPGAADIINDWVKENTRNKIESIVDELTPDHVLFLINAIYFKGNWTDEFDKSRTTEQPFYLADGSQKQHPLMSQTGKYKYYENEAFQAVSLPYGEERLSLYVFLPRENSNLETFTQQLNAEQWEQWMLQFRNRPGSIGLPRFKFEYDITLNDALKALGMEAAFEAGRADFSQMIDTPVNIDEVKHKTFVEVNEEGTEAAAVTSVAVVRTSAQIPEAPFEMIVNRPFFCAIRDNQTGAVLFMGSIVEPK
ncbi:MAG: serpin family protein [Kastovskya adunca ATA6-11-RM4]|jgi:serpin B|nr:serpin family protein [Kastovskya adunca ATA6-11-RM4]